MDPEPKRMNELLAGAMPELMTFAPATLARPRVTRERAVQLTGLLREEVAPLLPGLSAVFTPEQVALRMAEFEAIQARSLIYYAADLRVEAPWTSAQKARRVQLASNVREHDETLSGWAVPVFRKDQEASAEVAEILRGKGIRDDADDVVRLVALFRRRWSDVQGNVPLTEAYLAEAEADATELIGLLDLMSGDATGSPRDVRRRAYTWWARPYLELFHMARYQLRFDPEAHARVPAIVADRTVRTNAPDPGAPPAPPAAADPT